VGAGVNQQNEVLPHHQRQRCQKGPLVRIQLRAGPCGTGVIGIAAASRGRDGRVIVVAAHQPGT